MTELEENTVRKFVDKAFANLDEREREAAVSLFQFVTRHSASAEEDIRMTGELNTFVSGYNYRKNFDIKLDNVLSVLGTCDKTETA